MIDEERLISLFATLRISDMVEELEGINDNLDRLNSILDKQLTEIALSTYTQKDHLEGIRSVLGSLVTAIREKG